MKRKIASILFLLGIIIPLIVFAAEVIIDSTVSTSAAGHNTSSPNTVFISDLVGYMFYEDSTNQCVYQKTTDGGATWGGTVVFDSQTDCIGTAVWYDRWTPGDTTGTIIHVATMDGADMFYTSFDTNGDTASTPVNATGANQAGTFTNGATIHSVTKSTTGVVYMGLNDGSDSFVIKCSTSCTSASNWTEAGLINPFDLTTDWIILQPLASGQIMAIRYDISLDDIQSKVYTPGTDLWDVSWVTIDAAAVMNTTYDGGFGATVHPTTNDIYLAYAASNGSFGTDDDIRTAVYSGGSWTLKTDVLTNDAKGIVGAKIGINSNNGDVYVAYTARTTPGGGTTGNIYYKQSTDGMTSWGSETQVNSTQSNLYGMQMNIVSGERFYVGYVDTSNNDQLGNTLADLTAPTFAQSAFRFFANTNSTDVGSALAAQDTASSLSATGDSFRLRALLHVAGDGVLTNGETFKLQFVGKGSGTCASPSGGTPASYTDVTGSTVIAYNNNASPSDGAALTANASDPTHSGHTINLQTYEESNNFSNSQSAIASGADGKWDFSLIDNGASASTAYCLRVVKSSGTVLDTYTVYPQITTAATVDTTAPAAVSNLSLSSTTTSSFLVSWTAPGDDNSSGTATSYDLRYSTSLINSGNFSSATAVTGEPTPSVAGTGESMTVSGLSAATQYYFAIKASDEVPNTAVISNVTSGTTSSAADSTAPAAVTNLAVSTIGTTTVSFTWTAPGDDNNTGTATSYDFRYSTSPITSGNFSSATAATGEPTPSVAGTGEVFTLSSLATSTTYYFALKTSDEAPNTSAISNLPNAMTLNGVPVNSQISPTSKLVGDAQFTLTVTGSDFASTSVVRFNGTNKTTSFTNTTELTATIPTSDLLVAGTYPITVFTGSPGGGTSGAQTFTVNLVPDTTAPADTTSLSVGSVGANSVALSWTAPGDDNTTGTATSYDVRYSTALITSGNFSSASAATGEPTPSVAGTTENLTISGLASSTLYYFALKTSDEVPNTSGISNVTSTTTITSGDAVSPSDVSDLAVSTTAASSIGLTWTAPGDDGTSGTATSYDVRYSTSPITSGNFSSATAATGEPTPSVAGTGESMTVSGLDPQVTYYFAIKALDEASNSSAISNVVSGTTASELASSVTIPPQSDGVAPRITVLSFSGRAYPNVQVRFYRKGGQDQNFINTYIVETTARADAKGNFTKEFQALLSGEYLFSIEARDKDGRSSGIYSFPVDLLNLNKVVSDLIFLPPTVEIRERSVGRGSPLVVIGYASPNTQIEAEVDSFLTFRTDSKEDGSYQLSIPTTRFSSKSHTIRLRQIDSSGLRSRLSAIKTFTVLATSYPRADFNGDGKISISDWSVFLFRWRTSDVKLKSLLDINADGKVDVSDFSLMLRAIKR